MAGYEFSAEVENDLFEIWIAIAGHNEAAAGRVEDELRRTFGSLAECPGQGHRRRELSGRLRFWPVWDYLVAYRPEPSPILILGVLHGRRNPDTLAKILRSRQRLEHS